MKKVITYFAFLLTVCISCPSPSYAIDTKSNQKVKQVKLKQVKLKINELLEELKKSQDKDLKEDKSETILENSSEPTPKSIYIIIENKLKEKIKDTLIIKEN